MLSSTTTTKMEERRTMDVANQLNQISVLFSPAATKIKERPTTMNVANQLKQMSGSSSPTESRYCYGQSGSSSPTEFRYCYGQSGSSSPTESRYCYGQSGSSSPTESRYCYGQSGSSSPIESRYCYGQSLRINWEIGMQIAMHSASKQEERHNFLRMLITRLKKKLCSMNKSEDLLIEEIIDSINVNCAPIRSFSSKELQKATDNYDSRHVLHEDGWNKWYKGFADGRYITIKKAENNHRLDSVIKDIVIAMHMNTHTNVLKLLGICLETQISILVYEYAENGILCNHICTSNGFHPQPLLRWESRLRIATEIAKTVAYLHTAFITPIIHRNIKPSNVFLDGNNVAKLSDFTISIPVPEGETQVEDVICGTVGFIAPEYFRTGTVTDKNGVFSYGAFLFELLTGKRPFELYRVADGGDYDGFFLLNRFRNHVQSDEANSILDPKILEEMGRSDVQQQVQAVSGIALRCMEENMEERPTMVDVAIQLEQIAEWD